MYVALENSSTPIYPAPKNLPLFTDEERKVVGTAYKQQSRKAAIKIGLDYFRGEDEENGGRG